MVQDDAIFLTVVTGLVFLTYLDHLWHSIGLWRIEHSARSFRGLFIAVMLQVGLFRILIGVMGRAWPDNGAIQLIWSITAPILTVMLLSGGLVLSWTWRRGIRWRRP